MNWKTYRKKTTTKMVELTEKMLLGTDVLPPDCQVKDGQVIVHTREGDVLSAQVGDFIAEGVQGEHYPIGRKIQQSSYEEVAAGETEAQG